MFHEIIFKTIFEPQTEMELLQKVALERYSNRGTNIWSGLRRAGDEMFTVSFFFY